VTREPDFSEAFEFKYLEELDQIQLRQLISDLSAASPSKIVLEKRLGALRQLKFETVEAVLQQIIVDVEIAIVDCEAEFKEEPITFTFFLGKNLLFTNSLEIVQKVYNPTREDIGQIYYSYVIKYNHTQFLYWH
jgi:hypothetical protein